MAWLSGSPERFSLFLTLRCGPHSPRFRSGHIFLTFGSRSLSLTFRSGPLSLILRSRPLSLTFPPATVFLIVLSGPLFFTFRGSGGPRRLGKLSRKVGGFAPPAFSIFPGPRGPDFPNNKFQVPVNVKTLDPAKEQPRCGPCVFLFIFGPCLSY